MSTEGATFCLSLNGSSLSSFFSCTRDFWFRIFLCIHSVYAACCSEIVGWCLRSKLSLSLVSSCILKIKVCVPFFPRSMPCYKCQPSFFVFLAAHIQPIRLPLFTFRHPVLKSGHGWLQANNHDTHLHPTQPAHKPRAPKSHRYLPGLALLQPPSSSPRIAGKFFSPFSSFARGG